MEVVVNRWVDRKVEELLLAAARVASERADVQGLSSDRTQSPVGSPLSSFLFELLPEALLLLARVHNGAGKGDEGGRGSHLKTRAMFTALEKDVASLEARVSAVLRGGLSPALADAVRLVAAVGERLRGDLADARAERARQWQEEADGGGCVRKGAMAAGSRPTASEIFRKREDKKRRVEEKKALWQTMEGWARGAGAQAQEDTTHASLVDDVLEMAQRYKEGTLPWAAKILGVPVTADLERARKHFRLRAREFHPDASSHPRALEAFHLLQRAWEAFEALTTRHSSNPR